jgi:hypothetical protein
VVCLLDTDCEQSLIGKRLLGDVQLTETNLSLLAANGTPISVIGTFESSFDIERHLVKANVAVTEVVDELILGIDWLSANSGGKPVEFW